MPVLPLLQVRHGNPSSDPILVCTPAREMTDFSMALRRMAGDLIDAMRHHGAAGLAAPQAGIPLRLAVVEQEGGEPLALLNPRIVAERGTGLNRDRGLPLRPGAPLPGGASPCP